MSEHVYKHIELTGSSKNSIEEAIQNAIKVDEFSFSGWKIETP